MPDALPVASSATPDTGNRPDPSAYLASLSSEQREGWERTGVLPDVPSSSEPAEPAADAASAVPAVPAPSTDGNDKPPASEPGAPSNKPGHKGNAETRAAQLKAEIDGLLAQRARLRDELARATPRPAPAPDAAPAASSPASPRVTPSASDPNDPEPQWDTYAGNPEKYPDPTAAYTRDVALWGGREAYREQRARDAAAAEEQAQRDRAMSRRDAFNSRIAEAVEADGKFLETIAPTVKGMKSAAEARKLGLPIGPEQLLVEELVDSPAAPALMRHWTANPEDHQRLLACETPAQLLKEFGRQEAAVRDRAPAPPTPQKKTLTDAPAPPLTLGNRPTEVADERATAVRQGDFERYERAANARDVAAYRGR